MIDGDNNDTSINDSSQDDNSSTIDDGETTTSEEDEEERDELLNGVFGGVEFVDGVGKITIKSNSDFILKNMPSGYYYEVEEDDYTKQGYEMSSKASAGTIEDATIIEVEFINHFELENPPTKRTYLFVIFGTIFGLGLGIYTWKFMKV